MLKPQGYGVISYEDGARVEHDTISCGHCNQVVIVKPGTAATVYLIPQFLGPDREEPGAFCRQCMSPVCLRCHADGRCLPLMRRIEAMEARGRMFAAIWR